MPDYSEYQSTSSVYSFSKGPKSLYFGEGDNDLFGVILNVPQTDDDDEWGGTNRIAQERIIDTISRLIKEVEDPYGTGTDGLLNKMEALTGTSGLINLATPSMTLGNITLDGATNTITVGTSTSILTSTKLTLGTSFIIDSGTDAYTAKYKNVNIKLFDDNSNPRVSIFVNSKEYRFTGDTLSLPSGGTVSASEMSISGNFTATSVIVDNLTVNSNLKSNLVPSSSNYTLGTSGNRFENAFVRYITFNATVEPTPNPADYTIWMSGGVPQLKYKTGGGGSAHAIFDDQHSLIPFSHYSYDIGSNSRFFSNAYLRYLNLPSTADPSVLPGIYTIWMGSGDPQLKYQTGGGGTFTHAIFDDQHSLVPFTDDTYDIGFPGTVGNPQKKFKNIYAKNLDLTNEAVVGGGSNKTQLSNNGEITLTKGGQSRFIVADKYKKGSVSISVLPSDTDTPGTTVSLFYVVIDDIVTLYITENLFVNSVSSQCRIIPNNISGEWPEDILIHPTAQPGYVNAIVLNQNNVFSGGITVPSDVSDYMFLHAPVISSNHQLSTLGFGGSGTKGIVRQYVSYLAKTFS